MVINNQEKAKQDTEASIFTRQAAFKLKGKKKVRG